MKVMQEMLYQPKKKVYNGRSDPERFKLHQHGFQLISTPAMAAAKRNEGEAIYEAEITVSRLFPIAEAIVKHHCPGAIRAIAFDHILRNPQRLKEERAFSAKNKNTVIPPPPPVKAESSGLIKPMNNHRLASEPVVPSEPLSPTPLLLRHPSLKLGRRFRHCYSEEQATHEYYAVLAELGGSPSARLIHDKQMNALYHTKFLQGTLPHAHGDYTARSGRSRARQLLEPFTHDEKTLNYILSHRFAIINLWHAFKTVESQPLAMVTWPSSSPRDVSTSRITFPHRVGETYTVHSSDKQHWVYFDQVTPDEAILLKVYDSLEDDPHLARFCMHSAISPDPSLPSRPRESMEIRVLVLWAPNANSSLKEPFVPPHVRIDLDSHTKGIIEAPTKIENIPPSDHW
mmetsp:Transcript_3150/g.4843  ORF Transcript_3150/g.4843 Transcript_3150/m.4843 type:complete len:400 (-) Transcript_3150:237-1436(-)